MLTGGQRIGRVGGDEFVIVCPGTPIAAAPGSAAASSTRIGTAPYRIGDKAFQVGVSIGLIEGQPGHQDQGRDFECGPGLPRSEDGARRPGRL